MKITSPAFLHSDRLMTGLLSVDGSHFIPVENALQPDELFSCMQWSSFLPQSAPCGECIYSDDVKFSPDDETISIAGQAVYNASDIISLFKEFDVERCAGTRFSVEVSDSDCGLVIDHERAAVFGVTVAGMDCPYDSVPAPVNSMSLIDQRKIRQRLNAGRMICLLKQQLNL